MTTRERVVCTRCGKKTALSDEQVAEIRAKVPRMPVFIVANVCSECAANDRELRAEMEAWLNGEMAHWEHEVRSALVLPLEAIDRFVERWT
ncbi:MAG TPA: hypothetical protein VEV39_02620 [Gemmatimonadales bacterium]|nr:hypothetical protein [Gemmatimonadales bacterium]